MDDRRSGSAGFTLIEMLVALAVFALAALALIRLQGVTLSTAADLRARATAQIVAHNMMVTVLTDPAPPSIGEARGAVVNGGQSWSWVREVKKTDDSRLLQINLRVTGQGAPAVLTFIRPTT